MTIQSIEKDIRPILQQHGIKKAALFGSVARGEATAKSDVDILIEPPAHFSLVDLVGLKLKLKKLLGRKVDLVTFDAIHPLLEESILKSQRPIYEARSDSLS